MARLEDYERALDHLDERGDQEAVPRVRRRRLCRQFASRRWACVDPESGCDQCIRRCQLCAEASRNRHRELRVMILRAIDVEACIEWLKVGRWRKDITRDRVLLNIHAARVALPELSERTHDQLLLVWRACCEKSQ